MMNSQLETPAAALLPEFFTLRPIAFEYHYGKNQLVTVNARAAQGDTVFIRFTYPTQGGILIECETRRLSEVETTVAMRWALYWPLLFNQIQAIAQMTTGFERL